MYQLKVALEMPPYYYVRDLNGALALILDVHRATKYPTKRKAATAKRKVKEQYPDAEVLVEKVSGTPLPRSHPLVRELSKIFGGR